MALNITISNSLKAVRVEIIGNIASGKTTLANVLGEHLTSIYENFQENPFWESFYCEPEANSFETEITFTLQHYHQIKRELAKRIIFTCDFSLTLDKTYADVTLSGRRHEIYQQLLRELVDEVGPPDILVYLVCSEELLLERIRLRERESEKSITIDYLKALSTHIDQNIQEVDGLTRIINIDSAALNFTLEGSERNSVEQMILAEVQLVKK